VITPKALPPPLNALKRGLWLSCEALIYSLKERKKRRRKEEEEEKESTLIFHLK